MDTLCCSLQASQYQLSVRLDISAPRIIIPEDVRNRNTKMVKEIRVKKCFKDIIVFAKNLCMKEYFYPECVYFVKLNDVFLPCECQVILDLGRVTFGSVSDWSEEQEKNLEQAVLLDNTPTTETEDDDGKYKINFAEKFYCISATKT